MAAKLQAPRGTFDVLPADGRRRAALARATDELLGRAGYEPFESPVFEDTEVFARGVGEATDIVRKEMFSFEDKAGRSLTLRPEGTAGVCRAYVEHGMHKLPQPVKLRYWGPFFRHEAPQAGRYRQFTQIGAEALGSDDPSLDAEIVLLLVELLEAVGARDLRVRLSSLGTPETREAYLRGAGRLPARARVRALGGRARATRQQPAARVRRGPCGYPRGDGGRPAAARPARAPTTPSTSPACARCWTTPGCRTRWTPRSCAGSTTTRARSSRSSPGALGAQNALGGGGRYDRLVERLGGPDTPGVGFAAGVERILLATEARGRARRRRGVRGGVRARTRRGPPSPSPGSCVSAACGCSSSRPGARSRASSSRPTGSAPGPR